MSLDHARRYSDLLVYQKAKGISKSVFELSRGFPKEESYSLTDQMRRAARSIGAQIAEAWAKRRYEKHFVSKLTDADAEQMETQHWITEARDCGYLASEDAERLTQALLEVGRMLNGMIRKSSAFCGDPPSVVREDNLECFVNPNTDLPADHC